MKILKLLFFFSWVIISGCSGYQLVEKNHLFSKHNITSIKVPMFVNKTIYPDISAAFTNELIDSLSNFNNLSVDGGSNLVPGDHLLIGILTTNVGEKNVTDPIIRIYTGNSSGLRSSIGERPDFFLTAQFQSKILLELILIKNPLIKGKIQGDKPSIIFHHTLPITFNVTNNVNENVSPDSYGVTNYTNNRGFFNFEIQKVAKKYAQIMENMIGD